VSRKENRKGNNERRRKRGIWIGWRRGWKGRIEQQDGTTSWNKRLENRENERVEESGH
jgi:hypothetical protein